jgi:hypothetical protein
MEMAFLLGVGREWAGAWQSCHGGQPPLTLREQGSETARTASPQESM